MPEVLPAVGPGPNSVCSEVAKTLRAGRGRAVQIAGVVEERRRPVSRVQGASTRGSSRSIVLKGIPRRGGPGPFPSGISSWFGRARLLPSLLNSPRWCPARPEPRPPAENETARRGGPSPLRRFPSSALTTCWASAGPAACRRGSFPCGRSRASPRTAPSPSPCGRGART